GRSHRRALLTSRGEPGGCREATTRHAGAAAAGCTASTIRFPRCWRSPTVDCDRPPRTPVIERRSMADAVVRPKKPATKKRTPAGGAPTAAHTAAEADEARIDLALVADRLLGTWADTRREARELIKD